MMWGKGGSGESKAFGSGGFIGPQPKSNFESEAVGEGEGKKIKRSSNIVPVTVRQILECEDDVLMIVDTEPLVITVLGLVTAVEQTTTRVSLYIDDQTGTIECVNYVGTDETSPREFPFFPVKGVYGRVVGQMRTMMGNKFVVLFKFLPLTQMNEITCHLLEVMQIPIKLKKLKDVEAEKKDVEIDVGAPGIRNR